MLILKNYNHIYLKREQTKNFTRRNISIFVPFCDTPLSNNDLIFGSLSTSDYKGGGTSLQKFYLNKILKQCALDNQHHSSMRSAIESLFNSRLSPGIDDLYVELLDTARNMKSRIIDFGQTPTMEDLNFMKNESYALLKSFANINGELWEMQWALKAKLGQLKELNAKLEDLKGRCVEAINQIPQHPQFHSEEERVAAFNYFNGQILEFNCENK